MIQIFRHFCKTLPKNSFQPPKLQYLRAPFSTNYKPVNNKFQVNPNNSSFEISPKSNVPVQEKPQNQNLSSKDIENLQNSASEKNISLPQNNLEPAKNNVEAKSMVTERLSKRLSRLGICSRRQAEKLIKTGIVKVNNKAVVNNVPVTAKDKITVFTNHGEKIPMKQDTKIWIFNKPRGLICTHNDPQGRKTIFEYLKESGFKSDYFISVGRLDFLSEGLILLTNDGELAQLLEKPESNIERSYRVRVFGRFDELKLQKIRKGVLIKGVKYGPYWVEIEKRQTRNTWLRMRLTTGKNREIRRVMQKFSLRVDRIQRIKYGPYTLAGIEHGNWQEVVIAPQIKRMLYLGMRKKLEQKQLQLEANNSDLQKISNDKPNMVELDNGRNIERAKTFPKAKIILKKLPSSSTTNKT